VLHGNVIRHGPRCTKPDFEFRVGGFWINILLRINSTHFDRPWPRKMCADSFWQLVDYGLTPFFLCRQVFRRRDIGHICLMLKAFFLNLKGRR